MSIWSTLWSTSAWQVDYTPTDHSGQVDLCINGSWNDCIRLTVSEDSDYNQASEVMLDRAQALELGRRLTEWAETPTQLTGLASTQLHTGEG